MLVCRAFALPEAAERPQVSNVPARHQRPGSAQILISVFIGSNLAVQEAP